MALLLLCSGKPRQHTGRNVICHQHLHSCFLRCCRSWCCTATMKISGKAEGFRQVFSAVIEVWFSWCSNGLSSFPCISRVSLLCNKRQLKLIPRVWGFFLYPGNLVRKDYSEILPIGCCLVETITVGDGNSIGLKLAYGHLESIKWWSWGAMKRSRSFWVDGLEFRFCSIKLSWNLAAVSSWCFNREISS